MLSIDFKKGKLEVGIMGAPQAGHEDSLNEFRFQVPSGLKDCIMDVQAFRYDYSWYQASHIAYILHIGRVEENRRATEKDTCCSTE